MLWLDENMYCVTGQYKLSNSLDLSRGRRKQGAHWRLGGLEIANRQSPKVKNPKIFPASDAAMVSIFELENV